jgi:hypothetical protein
MTGLSAWPRIGAQRPCCFRWEPRLRLSSPGAAAHGAGNRRSPAGIGRRGRHEPTKPRRAMEVDEARSRCYAALLAGTAVDDRSVARHTFRAERLGTPAVAS